MSATAHPLYSLLLIDIAGVNKVSGGRSRGRLVLVDLAGSERVSKSGAVGSRMKEAQNINKCVCGFRLHRPPLYSSRVCCACVCLPSVATTALRASEACRCVRNHTCACVLVVARRSLSALGNVIAALATKSTHVPFRDSKLTYVLQDSLGKDNKTLMIVQVNPLASSRGESVCSLNFASRVRTVELGKARATGGDSDEVLRARAAVRCAACSRSHSVGALPFRANVSPPRVAYAAPSPAPLLCWSRPWMSRAVRVSVSSRAVTERSGRD